MLQLILKGLLSGAMVVGISEVSKRYSLMGAILASLPLTSILAMFWLYLDTKNVDSVRSLSLGIFWMVIPSLFFFIVFPFLLKNGIRFFPAMALACVSTSVVYFGYAAALKKFGW